MQRGEDVVRTGKDVGLSSSAASDAGDGGSKSLSHWRARQARYEGAGLPFPFCGACRVEVEEEEEGCAGAGSSSECRRGELCVLVIVAVLVFLAFVVLESRTESGDNGAGGTAGQPRAQTSLS